MPFIEIRSSGSPCLEQFEKSVDSKLLSCDSTQFWSCKNDFEALIKSNFITEITNKLLETLLVDPLTTDLRNQVNRTLVLQKEFYSLVVSWDEDTELDDGSLNTHGSHAMLSLICDRPVNIDFYKLPDGDMEVYEPGKVLSHSHTTEVGTSEVIEVHGDKWIVDIQPAKKLVVVTFILEPLWNQIWAYDRSTLKSWSTSASTLTHTQIKLSLEILRAFGDEDSVDVVQDLCRHPNHDIRWEAIKTLGTLRVDLVEEELIAATQDVHPHIRAAASKALSQLYAYQKEFADGTHH